MIVELEPSEKRNIRTIELIEDWKKSIKPKEGLRNLIIKREREALQDLDIDIRLIAKNTSLNEMKKASEYIKENLLLYQGVSDIKDNLPVGEKRNFFYSYRKRKKFRF